MKMPLKGLRNEDAPERGVELLTVSEIPYFFFDQVHGKWAGLAGRKLCKVAFCVCVFCIVNQK